MFPSVMREGVYSACRFKLELVLLILSKLQVRMFMG